MEKSQKIETFIYLLIEAVEIDDSGYYISCLSQNQGIDEAKNAIYDRLKGDRILNCYLAEVGIVNSEEIEISKYESQPVNNIRLGKEKYKFVSNNEFNFITPKGIAKSAHSIADFEDLKLSYSILNDSYATYTVEIIPDLFTFETVVEFLFKHSVPGLDFLAIYIDNAYDNEEDGENVMWVRVDSKENLLHFLNESKSNILENGFLSIEFGEEESNNRVSITKTKEIVFWTESEKDLVIILQKLEELGFSETSNNVSIGNDFEYFKYRMTDSLNRKDLSTYLELNSFEAYDS